MSGGPRAEFRPDASPSAAAERRQLTLLFSDIVDSTVLATRLDPEDLQEIIRAYHRCCTEATRGFGGLVARYMGDGVLAYFGYPLAHENDAECAVRAGLAVVDAVSRLGMSGEPALQVRVGIATGLVVVGDLIGEGISREQNVVGDTPNLAARLQSLAEPGTVVIASSTRQLLGNRFELADLGSRSVRGFATPVPLWRVLRENDTTSRLAALKKAELGPLIDRVNELALLADRWDRAKKGEGQVVGLSAEPGVGKSRLARAVVDRLSAENVARLLYHCSPFHGNSALHPVIEQLQRAAEFSTGDAPETKHAKLEALTERLGGGPETVAFLAYLLSLSGSEKHPRQDLSPPQQMEATLAALAHLIGDFARSQPVLIVAEDLHWIDPTSLALLELIMDRVRTLPILMIVTFRPEFSLTRQGDHISTLTLNRLNQWETLDLLRQVTGGKAIPPEMRDQIVIKTDGIPLFVEELTKAILESGVLRDSGDHYELALPIPAISVPATLRDSLMARLDRLSPVKEVAQIGAAIGRSFSHELLAALSPMPAAALGGALDQLVAAGLIFRSGTPPRADYTFKHALVQDTAYDSLLRTRRRTLHAQIAKTLREQFPEIGVAQPEVLAHHYTLAGDAERAVEYWSKAGRRSAERSSPREAIGHFEKALEVLQALAETADRHRQELAIRIGLVTPTMSLTGYASLETENALAKARAIADKVGETARLFPIVYGEWVSKFVRGQIGAARELAEHFLRLAAGQADTTPVMVSHRMLGATLTNLGELPRARAELETCIKLYEPAIHAASASLYGQDSRVSALCFLSWTLLISGDPGKALATAQQAVDFAGEIKHANTQGVAHFLAGVILRELIRDLPAAQDHTSRTIALAEGQGLAMWLFAARIVEGWLMAQRGAARAAVPSMRKAIEDIRGIGVCILMPHFLGLLADVLGRSEEPDSGLDALAAALAQMRESGERIWEADLQRLKGELLAAKGGKRAEAAAEAALFEAIGVARQQGARFWELRATTSLARLLSKQGKEDRAADLLTPICLWPDDVMVPDLGAARALLRQLTGDRPSGRS